MQDAPKEEKVPDRDQSEQPSGPGPMTRLALSNMLRLSVAETGRAEGDSNRLWESFFSSLSSINRQYTGSGKPAGAFEIDLHDLWFTYYHAAKNTIDTNPMLDRLVVQIIQTREIGPLCAPSPADASVMTKATTSDGVIWTELPFLVPDMTAFWDQDWSTMSANNLLSFATFLAKLASVGVCQDRLSSIGLALLRSTLETPRPLGASAEEHVEDPSRLAHSVTVAALLPPVNSWLCDAGYKIVQLADARWSSEACSLGELFRSDPSCSDTTPVGFSPERWIFWLRRLEQVAEEAESLGDARLGETARRSMDNMLFTVDERHSAVQQLLHNSPGIVQHQPTTVVFGAE